MTEDKYNANIIETMPSGVLLAAVCIEGVNGSSPVGDDVRHATISRVHGFALVEESFEDDSEVNNVIPLTESADGTLFLATAMDGYMGMIEVMPGLLLPETLDFRASPTPVDGDDDIVRALSNKVQLNAARRQVAALVERYNESLSLEEREPARVLKIARDHAPKEQAPAAPEPEDAKPEEGTTDK
jgi:hypothetical protein